MKKTSVNLMCLITLIFLIPIIVSPTDALDSYGGSLLTKSQTIDNTGENFNYLFSDGVLQWIYALNQNVIVKSVAISGDGQYIALTSFDNEATPHHSRLWMFNREGDVLWVYDYDGDGLAAVSQDGMYVAVNTGSLLFNNKGTLLNAKKVDCQGTWDGNIQLTSNGQVLVCSSGGTINIFDTTKTTQSSFDAGGGVKRISVSGDGQRIVVTGRGLKDPKKYGEGEYEDRIWMYDAKGNIVWVYDYNDEGLRNAVISSDGNSVAFIGDHDNFFYILNRDGSLRTKVTINAVIGTYRSIATTENGQLFLLGDGMNFALLDSAGNRVAELPTYHSSNGFAYQSHDMALSADGRYAAILDRSRLYLFRSDVQSQPLTNSVTTATTLTETVTTPVSPAPSPITPAPSLSSPVSQIPTSAIAPTITQTRTAPITAAFSATPQKGGPAPFPVTFTDTSSGSGITSRIWQYKQDSGFWSFLAQWTTFTPDPVTHLFTFDKAGSYDIKLIVRGTDGSDEEIKTGYITVGCDFSTQPGTEHCFGGIGVQCDGFPFIAAMKKDESTCSVTGPMSVGSILHDRCCITTGNTGVWCAHPDGSDKCQNEWNEAVKDSSASIFESPRKWETSFGPYPLGNTGDDVTKSLQVPSGERVPLDKISMCRKQKCVEDNNGDPIQNRDAVGEYCICQ